MAVIPFGEPFKRIVVSKRQCIRTINIIFHTLFRHTLAMAREQLFPMHQSVNHTLICNNINHHALINHCMHQLLHENEGGMPRSSQLPNGWIVRYSAVPSYDSQGNDIEFGISPDVPAALQPDDISRGYDTIIDTARRILRK